MAGQGGHTKFKPGKSGNPSGRPKDPLRGELRKLSAAEFRDVANLVLRGNYGDCLKIAKEKTASIPMLLTAQAVLGAFQRKEFGTLNLILDRLIGKPAQAIELVDSTEDETLDPNRILSFSEFCKRAGYPSPFPKQIEMRKFGIDEEGARLLLGARGYGKTDYVTVLGVAYRIYLDCHGGNTPTFTVLIVSKSEERNSAMLDEIRKACEASGVIFVKGNSSCLRVEGLLGKDHSVSTVTIGSTSVRGRHPKLIIMDDPVTEDDVSEATRKRVQRLYNELHKLCSNIVIIGQPVHRADLYQTLRPLLKALEVPHGSIPELDVDLEAMALAGVSKESISASYLLKVIVSDFDPFERIRFIDDFPRSTTPAVGFIDPSFEGGDFTALTIGKSYGEGVAIKGRAWKKAWNHCLDDIVRELLACGVKRVCFETNSLGDQPVELLRSALPPGVGVIGRKSNGNKHSRIMAAGVFAEYLHLAKTSDRVYIEQVTSYEYGAKHDDCPDSLASLLTWLGLVRGKEGAR